MQKLSSLILGTLTAGTLLLGLGVQSSNAVVIGFETVEGYTIGSVAGQPASGTQWSVTGGGIGNVAGPSGNPGQYLSVTHDGTAGDNFQTVRYTPTNADLGASGFPEPIAFSFDLRLDSYDGATNTNYGTISLLRDAAGANTGRALRLGFNLNGAVQVVSSTFNGGSLTLSGGNRPFTSSTNWVTFSGVANFATQETTLSINGVAVNSGNPFAFASPTGTGSDAYGSFEGSVSNLAGTYSIDNISLQAVPEPGSAVLLAGSLALGFTLRRRRR